jgi:hypothetical protein
METRHGEATGVAALYDEEGNLREIVLVLED